MVDVNITAIVFYLNSVCNNKYPIQIYPHIYIMYVAIIIIIIILYYFLTKNSIIIGGAKYNSALIFFGFREDEKTCNDLVAIIKSKIPTVYINDTNTKPDVIICHSIGIIDAIIAQNKYNCPVIAIDTSPNLKESLYEMKPPQELVQKISSAPDLTNISNEFTLLRRYNPKVATIIDKSDHYMSNKYPTKFKIIHLPQNATHHLWRTEIGKKELLKLL